MGVLLRFYIIKPERILVILIPLTLILWGGCEKDQSTEQTIVIVYGPSIYHYDNGQKMLEINTKVDNEDGTWLRDQFWKDGQDGITK